MFRRLCYGNLHKKYKATLRVQKYGQEIHTGPEVRAERILSISDYTKTKNLVDENIIQALPKTIGCPDCADGGAEWIEIQSIDIHKKVTFEYLNEPNSLTALVTELRELQGSLYNQGKK